MKTSTFLHRYSSGSYHFCSVMLEVIEFIEEISKEEMWDVIMTFQLWVYKYSPFDWELIVPLSVILKAERRRKIWEKIFHDNGLEFSPKYLVNGSNYRKPEKVRMALKTAREV